MVAGADAVDVVIEADTLRFSGMFVLGVIVGVESGISIISMSCSAAL